jgi:hypothetical protein
MNAELISRPRSLWVGRSPRTAADAPVGLSLSYFA